MRPMPSSLQELFAEPLRHLGDEDPKLRGIHAPEAERGARKPGVTAQFLENAAQYHERYRNVDGMRGYLGGILGHRDGRVQVILDVGSGSGNSIIPLLDLYPHAYCVATDISPQLLAILRDELEGNPRHRGRYGLVCMDVNHDRFRAGAFDLAVGIAILHHIVDPRRVLRACANALAPGGMALFVEPFETAHGVLRMAYRRVLAEARHRGARDPGFGMLERMVVDHEARLRDKADPIFDRLDDKWYFTRTWLEDAASAPEWAHCRVEAIDAGPDPLVSHAREDLMHGLGAREDALPEWAWDEIRRHQRFFSREGLRDLLFDAAIILRRSEQACPSPSGARRAG